MQPLKIAVATRCFRQPLRPSLDSAAATGASGVQFDARHELRREDFSGTGRRELLHHLDDLRLRVASLDFPTRRNLADPEMLDARLSGLRSALEFAFELKARVVTVRLGPIPGDPDSAAYKTLVEVLNDLARHANHVGAVPALTTAGDAPEDVAKLLAGVDQGPMGLNLDPSTFVAAGRKPAEAVRVLHASISHVRVRDAVRDADGGVEVAVGRGEVAWDEFLALLQEAEYDGWLTVDRTQGDDVAGDAVRAVKFVKRVATG